jgi:hypothetical protein
MRRWEGPFNARAMIADLPEQAGDAAQDDIRRHPLDYSLVMSLANAIDGVTGRREVVRRAIFGLRRRVDHRHAGRWLDRLIDAGWAAVRDA